MIRYTLFWHIQESENTPHQYILTLSDAALGMVGQRSATELQETEYAQVGCPALTISGQYGALRVDFPINGVIVESSRALTRFTIQVIHDDQFLSFSEEPLVFEGAINDVLSLQ